MKWSQQESKLQNQLYQIQQWYSTKLPMPQVLKEKIKTKAATNTIILKIFTIMTNNNNHNVSIIKV